MDGEQPKWFETEIARGLTRLRALALPFSPSDEFTKTIDIWAQDLWSQGQWPDDPDPATSSIGAAINQIRYTFQVLACESEQWPPPSDFLAALVRIQDPHQFKPDPKQPRLPPPPPPTPAEREAAERARQRFLENVRSLGKGHAIESAAREIERITGDTP